MKKIAAHTGIFILIVASLTLYSYLGYKLGHSAGQDAGWREAIETHEFPTGSQIQNLAEVCTQ